MSDPGEGDEGRVSKSTLSFGEALARVTEALPAGVAHPPIDRLIAYHRRELSDAEASALAEHLSLCADCTSELLDAAAFLDDSEAEEDDAAEAESLWRQMEGTLRPFRPPAAERAEPEAPRPPVARFEDHRAAAAKRNRPPVLRSLRFAYSLAAVFAALSVGLLGFVLRSGISGVPAFRLNEAIYDLAPSETERGEAATAIRYEGRDSVTLILNPAAEAKVAVYGVRFRDPAGRVIREATGLAPQKFGRFQLGVPRGALPDGTYQVELYGLAGDREVPLGIYRLSLSR